MRFGRSRRAPMPPWRGAGWCKWCGEPVLHPECHKSAGQPNVRRFWHPDCVVAHNIAHHSDKMRRALSKRDKGWCAGCGRQCNVHPDYATWEADHIIPLWSIPHDIALADRDRFWGMGNLQTLCGECHGRKSASEAAVRATSDARKLAA